MLTDLFAYCMHFGSLRQSLKQCVESIKCVFISEDPIELTLGNMPRMEMQLQSCVRLLILDTFRLGLNLKCSVTFFYPSNQVDSFKGLISLCFCPISG